MTLVDFYSQYESSQLRYISMETTNSLSTLPLKCNEVSHKNAHVIQKLIEMRVSLSWRGSKFEYGLTMFNQYK